MKYSILVVAATLLLQSSDGFSPAHGAARHNTKLGVASATKPTGTSYLPTETVERAEKGSPIEKVKLEKDGTSAFIDVYEYARKIREGEMTWEEVEKADLDTVSGRRHNENIFSLTQIQ